MLDEWCDHQGHVLREIPGLMLHYCSDLTQEKIMLHLLGCEQCRGQLLVGPIAGVVIPAFRLAIFACYGTEKEKKTFLSACECNSSLPESKQEEFARFVATYSPPFVDIVPPLVLPFEWRQE